MISSEKKKKELLNCRAQQSCFTEVLNAQLAFNKVAHRAAQCKKPHTIVEELIPSAIDVVSTMIDDATASKLKAIPLADNNIARRIYDMSKDTEEQLNEKIGHNCFALQMDEVSDSNKEFINSIHQIH